MLRNIISNIISKEKVLPLNHRGSRGRAFEYRFLERSLEVEADTPFVGARVVVGQAAHITYADEFEDIVDAGFHLPVRLVAHDMRSGGETVDEVIICVFCRVVLIRERSPESFHIDKLPPFQSSDKRDTVEDLSVEVPFPAPEHLSVVEELPVLDE